MSRIDLILTTHNDLLFTNNDVTIGESDNQHARLLFATKKGDWTQFPNAGINIVQYLKGVFDGEARRNVRLQMEGDSYKVETLDFDVNTGVLNLNFSY
jgi:predicted translin family RNA/ssDNA-binding protein